jgi:hypothetical protein
MMLYFERFSALVSATQTDMHVLCYHTVVC